MEKNIVSLTDALEKIDLTTTQRTRAEELYMNICTAIEEITGLNIDFYSQGSFATRTVVRPFKDGKDQLYDVDVICEVKKLSEGTSSEELMDTFEDALKSSRYSKKYRRWDKCFTVEYEEKNGDDFSIDIIPAKPASTEVLADIVSITDYTELVQTSVEIPDVSDTKASWISNNPTGYIKWFNRQTFKFEQRFQSIDEETYTASIEELPEDSPTNKMRNVIKILKRLRDVYFYRSSSEGKPASIIITTLVAKLANRISIVENEYDLLKKVITELNQLKRFSKDLDFSELFREGYVVNEVINYDNGEWELKNPANGLDNILSSWNEKQTASLNFFKWIDYLNESINKYEDSSIEKSRKIVNFYDSLNLGSNVSSKVDFKVDESKARPWRN